MKKVFDYELKDQMVTYSKSSQKLTLKQPIDRSLICRSKSKGWVTPCSPKMSRIALLQTAFMEIQMFPGGFWHTPCPSQLHLLEE